MCGPGMAAGLASFDWFGGVLLLVLTVGVLGLAVGVAVLWRRFNASTPPAIEGDADPAQRMLRDRYARGEISTEEFEERRSSLSV